EWVRGRETDRHANISEFFDYTDIKGQNRILSLSLCVCVCVCVCLSPSQPRTNFLAGPPSLASLHLGRDGSLTNHGPVGVSDGASALRSLSVSSMRGSCSSTHRSAGHASSASRAMAGSSTDARTASSGSSVWEGQLTSLVLSEYASTEMSIHALYIHELHKQQSGGELSRHTWHRQDSDDSSDSVTEEGGSGGGNTNTRKPIPRSHTFPISTPISTPGPIPSSNSGPNPDRGTTPGQEVAPLQSNSQRRYGGNTDSVGPGGRVVRSERVPMGGWAEEGRGGRHPDTVPEEGSEDDMPPNIHKVT
ncbi:unnamed protein product, partial [Oncorhynchus mykiss]